jgi:hypothetical protein
MKNLLIFILFSIGVTSCDTYTISGNISIRNQCRPLPEKVDISAIAVERRAILFQWVKQKNIPLIPQPDGSFEGQYKLTIKWPKNKPAPKHWTTPKIWGPNWETLCESMYCGIADSIPQYDCLDMATRPRRIAIQQKDIRYDLRSDCRCESGTFPGW